jgi:hypothetical protein
MVYQVAVLFLSLKKNITLPCGSSREIQEQEFPTDLQENFITVAVLLATLLRASVFFKQRKKKHCADIFQSLKPLPTL